MRRLADLVFALPLALASALACASGPAWDVTHTGQPFTNIQFTVNEGSWMSLDVSPDGKSIVFDLLDDIYSIPATGGVATLIAGGPALQRSPVFSPDGRQILYLSDASGSDNIWVADVDGSHARQVTHETVDLPLAPAWSADGHAIAAAKIYASFPRIWSSEIRLFDAYGAPRGGGQLLVSVPPNHRDVEEAAFSPDGRYLYYTQRLATSWVFYDANQINYGIMRRDLRSGEVEQVVAGFGGAFAPQVSRDGKQLAFVRRVKAKTVLFVLDLASHQERPVYDGLDRDLQAEFYPHGRYYPRYAWFPDNRHIAIWAKGKIFEVDVGSGAATQIPFQVTVRQQVTAPLRFRHDVAPRELTVRAVRNLAVSPDGRTAIFTALAHLWRKQLPGGRPTRFVSDDAFAFEPAYSRDGRRVAFVEWNDERGSALRIADADGGRASTIVTSPGVIRQPQFSPDGKFVVYRIQAGDPSMGGFRDKPGIYWVEAGGGKSHFIGQGDDAPMFTPDGRRVCYVSQEYAHGTVVQHLWSVRLDGFDKHELAYSAGADTTEIRPSPDLHWIAFRDRQQYFVLPFHRTGSPLLLDSRTTEVPVRALTVQGGFALTWSSDSSTLYWALGPALYRAEVAQPMTAGAAATRSFTSIGLTVPTDVPQGSLAFVNGRIITMRGEEVIERGTVVVTRNRIAAVGPSDRVAIPKGAKVIDVSGKTIMPGFVDAHGHIDCCYGTGVTPQKQPTRYAALAFGITTNFDPYCNELTSYESTETTEAGITVGPRWIGTGAPIYGRAQKDDFVYVPIDSFTDAQNVLARKTALGGIELKSYLLPARKQRQMLIKAARAAGVNVTIEGGGDFYMDLTAILDGHTNLEHNLPLATYYDDIVQFMSRAKAHETPTLVVAFGELFGENYMYQTTEAWKDPKVRIYDAYINSAYSPLGAPGDAPAYVRGMETIHAADDVYDIGFRSVARSIKKLDDAGVVINVGSHGQLPGLSMHWEMWLLAQGGMSNLRILRAATLNGASSLGVADQIGSLEVGKLADLIVLDGNPLQDIHNTNTVRYTMVNGRLYDSMTMNEIGNYDRPRTRFYWELANYHGIDWKDSWQR